MRPETVTYFARTNFRNDRRVFGIRCADRRAHFYVIGKTGTGKTTMLATLITQDIERGEGCALFDPHGDLARSVRENVPVDRLADLIHLDAADPAAPVGFNPLAHVDQTKRSLAASGLLEAMKMIWRDSWGPRLEHILRHSLLALLDQPEATLADIQRLLIDRLYRKEAARFITNSQVRDFWLKEYEGYSDRFRTEAIAPLQNKVGAFLAHPALNRILTRPKVAFDAREVIDEGKILIVDLAKGRAGEDAAALLGALLVSRLSLAALSRADIDESKRRDFFVYLDEFPIYTSVALSGMLSELRKYRLNLILAHQFLGQLELPVRDAVLGNVGTIVSFRLGLDDAEVLEKEFGPNITAADMTQLPNREIYLRLLVDGVASRPFSAETIIWPHPDAGARV